MKHVCSTTSSVRPSECPLFRDSLLLYPEGMPGVRVITLQDWHIHLDKLASRTRFVQCRFNFGRFSSPWWGGKTSRIDTRVHGPPTTSCIGSLLGCFDRGESGILEAEVEAVGEVGEKGQGKKRESISTQHGMLWPC
jgi:hypothetical protein